MAEILSQQQLKSLSKHKYSSEGTSITEPALQILWRWMVEQIPLWVAPNLITIVGLIINVGTSLLLMYYSPDAKTQAPGWVYASCGMGLFLYQCLDAMDGKQARRTGSSSPLGELFDHGCDALSTVFVSIATCCAMGLGLDPPSLYFLCFTAFFLFYCAHWQTYVSGTLRFGRIDVTEGQLVCIGVFLLTSVVGLRFWRVKIPLVGISLFHIPVVVAFFGGVMAAWNYFRVIFSGGGGKNGATVANTSVLFPAFPIAFVQISSLIQCGYTLIAKGSGLFALNPCLFTLTYGIFSAKVTCRLVVAHMTKSELAFIDTIYFGPLLLLINQFFDYAFPEYLLLWVSLIYASLDIVKYSYKVCTEIAAHLHICVFTIPYCKESNAAANKPETKKEPSTTPIRPSHQPTDASSSSSSPHPIRSLSPHSYARRSIHDNMATLDDDDVDDAPSKS